MNALDKRLLFGAFFKDYREDMDKDIKKTHDQLDKILRINLES